MVGYAEEAIVGQLNNVVNTQIDEMDTVKPLIDVLASGVIRGVVGVVGCNNARTPSNYNHLTIMKELIKNNGLIKVGEMEFHDIEGGFGEKIASFYGNKNMKVISFEHLLLIYNQI